MLTRMSHVAPAFRHILQAAIKSSTVMQRPAPLVFHVADYMSKPPVTIHRKVIIPVICQLENGVRCRWVWWDTALHALPLPPECMPAVLY